jgi:hypothetical protein
MSRILVVQPCKMLQQAFAVALFPEHHVRVLEKLPEVDPSAEADLVIIDAGALRERGLLAGGEDRVVRTWQIPVVWIGSDGRGAEATARHRLLLSAPLKRDDLRAAVGEGLRSSLEQTAAKPATKSPKAVPAKKKTAVPNPEPAVADNGKKIIELVEVIEEMSDPATEVEAGHED